MFRTNEKIYRNIKDGEGNYREESSIQKTKNEKNHPELSNSKPVIP